MNLHRRIRLVAIVALLGALVGCRGDGNISILGYSTAPNFDPNIRSVYIPIFKMMAFDASPYRGLDSQITEAIGRELNSRHSPIRVVSDPSCADTELIGTVTQINKISQNRNQYNQNREYDLQITVDVVWRDLRSGKVLSNSRAAAADSKPVPFDPNLPPPPLPLPPVIAVPITINAYGRVIPELGESNATGMKAATDNLARQLVNMMERPW